jgi:hypothetical protein
MFAVKGKIEKAAAKVGSGRPVLERVWLRTLADGRRVLEACDSYKLVQLPVEGADQDTDGPIPVEALKQARMSKIPTDKAIVANGTIEYATKTGRATEARPDIGTFPDSEKLWPAEPVVFEVGVNARFLLDIAEAYGAENVKIAFVQDPKNLGQPAALKPLLVSPLFGRGGKAPAEPEGRALLMPIRVG